MYLKKSIKANQKFAEGWKNDFKKKQNRGFKAYLPKS